MIPWIAVMALRYYFVGFYNSTYSPDRRRKIFNYIGGTALVLFIILRWANWYGDPLPFRNYGDIPKNVVSFSTPKIIHHRYNIC